MKKLLLIALCVVAVNALQCTDEFCSAIKCKAVTSCNGRIAKGICGCCDICIFSIREGERCNPFPFRGVPIFSECEPGLVCSVRTRTCINPLGPLVRNCESEQAAALAQHIPSHYIPQCEADGSYSAAQCYGSICKCVTREGNQIDNFIGPIGTNMSCNCARDMERFRGWHIIGKWFQCESNGDYKKIQCMGNLCSCVDEFGKPTGNTIDVSKKDTLNC